MTVPFLHRPVRRLSAAFAVAAAVLVFAPTCAPAAAATQAERSAATEAAFAALLSLPQGLPDDSLFLVDAGDQPPTDENELRAVLDAQLEAGADVNAYRHGGTLLLHALRAGLDDTALWLLAHGADPRLEVDGTSSSEPAQGRAAAQTGDDALQVALIFRRWRVADALLRRPALKPVTDTDRAFRWSTVFQANAGAPARAVRELRRLGVPLPGGWQGDCLLAHALDQGLVSLVLALPASTPRAAPGHITSRDVAVATLCAQDPAHAMPRTGPPTGDRFAHFTPADLARADARLAVPLLPSLLPALADTQDVAALARLPLRRPVDDPAFMRSLLVHALDEQVPPAVARAVLAGVPPARLSAALDDANLLTAWLRRFAGQPLEAYTWALNAAGEGVLGRHVDAAIAGTSSAATLGGGQMVPGTREDGAVVSPAHWEALIARLPAPPGVRADLPLTAFVPEAAWPTLFAHRYTLSREELAQALRASASPADLKRRWPLLQAASSPAARAQALANLVQPWTQGCAYEWFAPTAQDVARVKWLSDAGLRLPKPAVLAVSCEQFMAPALRDALLATGAMVAAPPAGRLHFVLDHPACEPRPDPALLRALAEARFSGDTPDASDPMQAPRPEVVQAIAEPGRSTCAWLVSGGQVSARAFIDDESFYMGYNRLTPCLGATLYGELWHVVDGHLRTETVGEGATEGGIALRETSSGHRYFLTWPVPGSTCDGIHPAALLGWTGKPGAQQLGVLGDDDPAKAALQRQCHLDDAGPCFGLPSDAVDEGAPSPGTDAGPAKLPAWDAAWSVEDFLDHYWQDHRQAFIDAFLALDTARLRAVVAEGIPAHWRAQALEALNASTMPVEAKRQRTAWMFRDKAGLAASFGAQYEAEAPPAVLGLVEWLPREDWRPLMTVLMGKQEALQQLRDAARAKHDARLACMFSKGLGEACVPTPP